MQFSCNMRVKSIQDQDYGSEAVMEYVEGGGIDIVPQGEVTVHITEDVSPLAVDSVVTLTLEVASEVH